MNIAERLKKAMDSLKQISKHKIAGELSLAASVAKGTLEELEREELGDRREAAGLSRYEPDYGGPNHCSVCGGIVFGSHYHEVEESTYGNQA